jgi:type II secretory pathway component PulM
MNLSVPARLRDTLDGLAPRERNLIMLGLLLLLPVGFYLYVWQPINAERARLTQRVGQLQGELNRLRADSEEIKQLRARMPHRSGDSLETSARAAAARFGLTPQQTVMTAQGSDRLQVNMDNVAFDTWLRWVAELGLQGISLDACKVERLPAAGLVRVRATLKRASA